METKPKPSELIQHDDGRIYHLNLLPGEVASTVLLVGDPERVSQVSQFFDEVNFKQENREFRTHTGTYNGHPVSAMSTGIGPDNIDIVVNELDALFNVMLDKKESSYDTLNLVRIGTCGGLPPELKPGSAVVSHYAIGLDNLINFYAIPESPKEAALKEALYNHMEGNGGTIPFYVKRAAPPLLNRLANCGYPGITLTCPGFYGPQERGIRLRPSQPVLSSWQSFEWQGYPVQNLEMESSALFALAAGLGHEAATVALTLANRSTGDYLGPHEKAMNATIKNVLEALTKP